MKDLLIAGNRFTNEDIEKLQHIKSSIEVLKEDIDNKSYFAFYKAFTMNNDGEVYPSVISRDEHLTMVYAHIISEFNKLSVFSPPATDTDISE
jgi:hypothetical protein